MMKRTSSEGSDLGAEKGCKVSKSMDSESSSLEENFGTCRPIVSRCRTFLVENLELQSSLVLSILFEGRVLNDDQIETIENKEVEKARNEAFISFMGKRPIDDLNILKEALRRENQEHIANRLTDAEKEVSSTNWQGKDKQSAVGEKLMKSDSASSCGSEEGRASHVQDEGAQKRILVRAYDILKCCKLVEDIQASLGETANENLDALNNILQNMSRAMQAEKKSFKDKLTDACLDFCGVSDYTQMPYMMLKSILDKSSKMGKDFFDEMEAFDVVARYIGSYKNVKQAAELLKLLKFDQIKAEDKKKVKHHKLWNKVECPFFDKIIDLKDICGSLEDFDEDFIEIGFIILKGLLQRRKRLENTKDEMALFSNIAEWIKKNKNSCSEPYSLLESVKYDSMREEEARHVLQHDVWKDKACEMSLGKILDPKNFMPVDLPNLDVTKIHFIVIDVMLKHRWKSHTQIFEMVTNWIIAKSYEKPAYLLGRIDFAKLPNAASILEDPVWQQLGCSELRDQRKRELSVKAEGQSATYEQEAKQDEDMAMAGMVGEETSGKLTDTQTGLIPKHDAAAGNQEPSKGRTAGMEEEVAAKVEEGQEVYEKPFKDRLTHVSRALYGEKDFTYIPHALLKEILDCKKLLRGPEVQVLMAFVDWLKKVDKKPTAKQEEKLIDLIFWDHVPEMDKNKVLTEFENRKPWFKKKNELCGQPPEAASSHT